MTTAIRSTGRLAAVAVLAALLLTVTPATTSAAPPAHDTGASAQTSDTTTVGVAVPSARFEVGIATTSDWTRVQIVPGAVVAHRVVQAPDGVQVETRSDGWRVLNPTGGKVVVVVEAVLNEVTGASDLKINVDKGWLGATYARVTNTTAEAFIGAQIHNDVRSLTDPNNRRSVTVTRDAFLGTQRLELPHADARQLVLAFYYPWFGTYDDPKLTDRPSDPRSTWTYDGVLSMTSQARRNGVDGFIVSWAGEDANGPAFDRAHQAARATDGLITGYLETTAARDVTGRIPLTTLLAWLEQLATRADGSFLATEDGTPVVFVWQMAEVPVWGWQLILDELERRGTPVVLVGDAHGDAYAEVSWGVHRYDPLGEPAERARSSQYRDADLRAQALLDGTDPRLHVEGVAPGFDDHLVRDGNEIIERGANGERYEATWDAALSGDPDWITVTSWNEWYEGTSIEPGLETGARALWQTRDRAAAWRG